jgi:hypothetical protein
MCAMLYVLVLLAACFLFYTWGGRLQVRALLRGDAWLEMVSYACAMATGLMASLSGVLLLQERVPIGAWVWEISILSTLLSIMSGEWLYARNARICLKLLAPLRSENGER